MANKMAKAERDEIQLLWAGVAQESQVKSLALQNALKVVRDTAECCLRGTYRYVCTHTGSLDRTLHCSWPGAGST